MKKAGKRGFVSIVALMIFAILTIVGLTVQRATMDSITNIRNSNNFYMARDLSGSLGEMTLLTLKTVDAGYNSSVKCVITNGVVDTAKSGSTCTGLVTPFLNLLAGKNATIEVVVSGMNDEKLGGACFGLGTSGCYMVPAWWSGNVSDQCKNYLSQAPAKTSQESLNHPCNWNRLQSGSSTLDRAVIPLYYTDATGTVVNSLKDEVSNSRFLLRVRLPCKSYNLATASGCSDSERYTLSPNSDKKAILVQWQINGECDEDNDEVADGGDCGMVPYLKYNGENIDGSFSGINKLSFESLLTKYSNNIQLNSSEKFFYVDTSGYSSYMAIYKKLNKLIKPYLVINLSEKLVGDNSVTVPFLEYQLLAIDKVSDARTKIYTSVTIENSGAEKTIYKSNQSSLVDFAIQN